MSVCEICQKDFKQKWRLDRHKNKKRPCEKVNQISPLENQISLSENRISPSKNQISPSDEITTKCQFCNKECKGNLKRHETSCMLGKDDVRLLEIELGIPYRECEKLKCRFCNNFFSRTDKILNHEIICKEKKIYLATLEGQKIAKDTGKSVQVNVYNITNDNRITHHNRSISNDNRSITDNRSISNDNRSINTIQSSEPILRKFGEENT